MFFAHFRIATEKEKIVSVARLVKSATGDFDFYLFVFISILLATAGLLLDSAEVVIGSMLIAPVLYPLLALSLALAIPDVQLLFRSVRTLVLSFGMAVSVSWLLTALLKAVGLAETTTQLLARAEPSLLYFLVAFGSGFAVTYALVHAELSETLPGVAISVSLVPPVASIGVALGLGNLPVVAGASMLFALNVAGIVLAGLLVYTFSDMYKTHRVAHSAIAQEERRLKKEELALVGVRESSEEKE